MGKLENWKIEKLLGHNLGRVLTAHSTDWVHGPRSIVKNYYTKSDEVIEAKYLIIFILSLTVLLIADYRFAFMRSNRSLLNQFF